MNLEKLLVRLPTELSLTFSNKPNITKHNITVTLSIQFLGIEYNSNSFSNIKKAMKDLSIELERELESKFLLKNAIVRRLLQNLLKDIYSYI